MASTPVQIFTVDTTTGNVAINGNLFVKSANNNASWIVGDMIKANTLITLCNGNIVFNGSNGSVTVKDPDAPNSGTYTYINSGVLNQYYLGTLMRSLTNIESGQAKNNAETTLTGTYNVAPSVIVTPKNIQTYNATYKLQNQIFNCNLTTTSLGSGKYKIKPVATIGVAASTDYVQTPVRYDFATHGTEMAAAQSDVAIGDINPAIQTNNKTCVFTTDSVRTTTNCNKVVVNVTTYGVAAYGDYYTNRGMYVTNASHKWRIKYKLHSASTWSYSSYSTETTGVVGGQAVTSSLTQSLTTGDYDIAAEFVLKRTGTSSIGFSASASAFEPVRLYSNSGMSGSYIEIDPAYIQINSIQCSRPATTLTPTGTLNYIAVGR